MGERIALIADIHANDPALRATLDSIETFGIGRGLIAGDVVMRGEEPAEVVRRLKRLGWACVRGNTDRKVVQSAGLEASSRQLAKVGSRWWTRERLEPDCAAWLASLAVVARDTLDGHRIVVMHGGPDETAFDIGPDTPESDLIALAAEMDADCIVSGHTHRQAVHRAGDCLFVNPGSVGETPDALDRRPRWAWIDSVDGRLDAHLEAVEQPLARLRVNKSTV